MSAVGWRVLLCGCWLQARRAMRCNSAYTRGIIWLSALWSPLLQAVRSLVTSPCGSVSDTFQSSIQTVNCKSVTLAGKMVHLPEIARGLREQRADRQHSGG